MKHNYKLLTEKYINAKEATRANLQGMQNFMQSHVFKQNNTILGKLSLDNPFVKYLLDQAVKTGNIKDGMPWVDGYAVDYEEQAHEELTDDYYNGDIGCEYGGPDDPEFSEVQQNEKIMDIWHREYKEHLKANNPVQEATRANLKGMQKYMAPAKGAPAGTTGLKLYVNLHFLEDYFDDMEENSPVPPDAGEILPGIYSNGCSKDENDPQGTMFKIWLTTPTQINLINNAQEKEWELTPGERVAMNAFFGKIYQEVNINPEADAVPQLPYAIDPLGNSAWTGKPFIPEATRANLQGMQQFITLKQIPADYNTHRTGTIIGLTIDEITKILGFGPEEGDGDKTEYEWHFQYLGFKCAVWDYKRSYMRKQFSVYMPPEVGQALFGDNYTSEAQYPVNEATRANLTGMQQYASTVAQEDKMIEEVNKLDKSSTKLAIYMFNKLCALGIPPEDVVRIQLTVLYINTDRYGNELESSIQGLSDGELSTGEIFLVKYKQIAEDFKSGQLYDEYYFVNYDNEYCSVDPEWWESFENVPAIRKAMEKAATKQITEATRANLQGMQKYAENLLVSGIVCSFAPGEFYSNAGNIWPNAGRKEWYAIVVNPNDESNGTRAIEVYVLWSYNEKTGKLETNRTWLSADDLKPLKPERILTAQEMNEVRLRGKVVDKLKGLMVPDSKYKGHIL